MAPELKSVLFSSLDAEHSIYNLVVASDDIEETIYQDTSIVSEKEKELVVTFSSWRDEVREILLSINSDTSPKVLIRSISDKMLTAYHDSRLLDKYDMYDCLLNYWNEKLQDDVYAIKVSGYEAGREIDYEYAKKKAKDDNGETISVDDKSKVKSFDGALIPRSIVERIYFADECAAITSLEEQCGLIEADLDEMREEESGEDGLLREALNENGDSIPKANLTKRIKGLEAKKTSEVADTLVQITELFAAGKIDEIDALLTQNPALAALELQNKKGVFIESKIATALKAAQVDAVIPEIYADEYTALCAYQDKLSALDEVNKQLKTLRKMLDDKVEEKYGELTVDEIKHLLFDEKWMVRLSSDIGGQVDQVLNALASKALLIAKRYERTLKQIEEKASASKTAVMTWLRDRMNTMDEKVEISGLQIRILKKKNLKNLYIRVNPPDGDVTVSVPAGFPDEEIRLFVLRKLPEITKVRNRMNVQPRQSKREYVSGESCYLWGKPYRLQIVPGGKRYSIEKTPNRIIMTVPDGATTEGKEQALTEWYRMELKRVLEMQGFTSSGCFFGAS